MRILIAEDDPVSCRILEARLAGWGYEVIVTRDGKEALQVLASSDPPKIAILDWMMPDMDGVEVCRRVRNQGQDPYIYLILLTTLNREEDLVAGMDAGADDYVTKPFNANELRVRLRAGRRIIDQQEELIAAREALRSKAAHDQLTGLWNHEEILGILGRELAKVERERTRVGVIMADLDHFKLVNDTHGHLAGDAVLHDVAAKILSHTRPYDSVGRYGGEEFLVILPGCGLEEAEAFAERLRINIADEQLDTPEGKLMITISLGVAACSGPGCAVNALVKEADLALYRAKENGRNRVELSYSDGKDCEETGQVQITALGTAL